VHEVRAIPLLGGLAVARREQAGIVERRAERHPGAGRDDRGLVAA
jgi:hypothetical protein